MRPSSGLEPMLIIITAQCPPQARSRREYLGETIAASANHVIHKTLTDMKGDGGVIAIDEDGNYTFAFNTPGMYRGANKGGIFDAK